MDEVQHDMATLRSKWEGTAEKNNETRAKAEAVQVGFLLFQLFFQLFISC